MLLLSSCGDQEDTEATSTEAEETTPELSVVASIDVYADLAARITEETAEVQAIIDNPAVDPHSYEASPQDRLKIEQADVLIANGGGYDPFLTSLAESADKDDALIQVITGSGDHAGHGHDDDHADDHEEDGEHDEDEADQGEDTGGHAEDEHSEHGAEEDHGTEEGHSEDAHDHDESEEHGDEDEHSDHGHGDDQENEHVWYDLAMMSEFAIDLAEHLGEVSPDNAELYTDNAETLAEEIDALDERNRSLEAEGVTFMSTEPVSAYLLGDAGFEDETDQDFLSAIEHGDDVAPRLLQDALATAEDVDVLVYNEQTETNQSQQIREAAEAAGVPVVEFSETLPDDADDYLSWMDANIDQLEELLASD